MVDNNLKDTNPSAFWQYSMIIVYKAQKWIVLHSMLMMFNMVVNLKGIRNAQQYENIKTVRSLYCIPHFPLYALVWHGMKHQPANMAIIKNQYCTESCLPKVSFRSNLNG